MTELRQSKLAEMKQLFKNAPSFALNVLAGIHETTGHICFYRNSSKEMAIELLEKDHNIILISEEFYLKILEFKQIKFKKMLFYTAFREKTLSGYEDRIINFYINLSSNIFMEKYQQVLWKIALARVQDQPEGERRVWAAIEILETMTEEEIESVKMMVSAGAIG